MSDSTEPRAGDMPALPPTLPLPSTPDLRKEPAAAANDASTDQSAELAPTTSAPRSMFPRLRSRAVVTVVKAVCGLVLALLCGVLLSLAISQSTSPTAAGELVGVDRQPPVVKVGASDALSVPTAEKTVEAEASPDAPSVPTAEKVGEPESVIGLGVATPIQGETFDGHQFTWNVSVGSFYELSEDDLTEAAVREVPDGFTAAGFDIEAVLASAAIEPLGVFHLGSWEVRGGASGQSFGVENRRCEETRPGEFWGSVFVGGSVKGSVCGLVPREDVDHPDTVVVLTTDDGGIVFSAGGDTPRGAARVVPGLGIESLGAPSPFGEPATVHADALSAFASDHEWRVTVDRWQQVPADNPRADVAWVSFDIEFEVVRSQATLVPLLALDWQVLGGETLRVYNRRSIDRAGCGDDLFAGELRQGDTLTETVCIPILLADLDHPDTLIAMYYWGERITFSDE